MADYHDILLSGEDTQKVFKNLSFRRKAIRSKEKSGNIGRSIMEEYEIKNGTVTARFQDHGAELISLRKNGTEYIWNGNPDYWGRHAPVLFPFVGQVWDKKYRYQGTEYPMGQHGFARDMNFEEKRHIRDSISFILRENKETLAKYPFRFELEIKYTLGKSGAASVALSENGSISTPADVRGPAAGVADAAEEKSIPNEATKATGKKDVPKDTLTVEWIVRNPNMGPLYFSLGGHPAFMCPIDGRGDWPDYRIGLSKNGQKLSLAKIRPITEGGCFGEDLVTLHPENGTLTPSDELFAEDALVLEDHQVDHVSLIDPDGNEYLAVDSDAPCMGIWSPVGKHAPFICIEPWYGRADRVGFNGDLSEREYGNVLASGEVFRKSFTITI